MAGGIGLMDGVEDLLVGGIGLMDEGLMADAEGFMADPPIEPMSKCVGALILELGLLDDGGGRIVLGLMLNIL